MSEQPSPSPQASILPFRSVTEESKEALLHLVSSEVTSHASNILGLAVILFAYLTAVFNSGYFPKISVNLSCIPIRPTLDYSVVFIVFWVLTSGIFYSVMRLIYYGNFASETIIFSAKQGKSLEMKELWGDVSKSIQNRKGFAVIPMGWFSSGTSREKEGIWFSFAVGFVPSLILFVVFFVK